MSNARHGLESFLEAAPRSADPGVSVQVQRGLAFVNLRGNARDAAFAGAIEAALGQPLPATANTFTQDAHRAYWLGPDEWLVVSDKQAGSELAASLETAIAGMHAAVNDVSGGNVGLILTGGDVTHVLAKGCTLDLHPDSFAAMTCAQSGLARASVLLGKLDDRPAFEIVVRRSFSDYLARWFAHSARDHGISFAEG